MKYVGMMLVALSFVFAGCPKETAPVEAAPVAESLPPVEEAAAAEEPAAVSEEPAKETDSSGSSMEE